MEALPITTATSAAGRVPFFLYIDEFHHFITPSIAAILSGARKYGLGRTLAHQEMRQLKSRSEEVAGAVLGNAYTRLVFRVDDQDARTLAALAAGLPVLREWITNARSTLSTLLSIPARVTRNSP